MTTTFTKVQLRRGTADEWTRYNTILDAGEIGFETDTYRFKIGQVNPETNVLASWNELDYFGNVLTGDNIEIIGGNIDINGSINVENACFDGDVVPCTGNIYTLGEAARRWKSASLSDSVTIGDVELTFGPAGESTGVSDTFLKVNGDDVATRTELEKVTSDNLNLANPQVDYAPDIQLYLDALFRVLERDLPPREGISTQSQFNAWVVAALEHVDEVAHSGGVDENNNIIIGGEGINVIIGPGPGNDNGNGFDCSEQLDIYAHTTVHCMLEAKQGVKVKNGRDQDFVKANGSISNLIPLNQSYWVDVERL